jgi:hypothetical protein
MVDSQIFQQNMPVEDFAAAVVLGLVPGAEPEVKFGHNPNVSQNIETDIWERGATQQIYIFPATAGEVLEVVGNVADTQDVVVLGLDAAGLPQREDLTLNGATAVPIPGVWTSITRIFNDGSTAVVGPVLVQGDGSTSTDVFASMTADDQQSSQAIYTVPSNKVAVLHNFSTAVNKSGGADVSCVFVMKVAKPGKVFRTQIRYGLQVKGTSNISSNLIIPIVAGPGFNIKVTANPSANTTDVSTEFSMLLVDKDIIPPEVLAAIIAG